MHKQCKKRIQKIRDAVEIMRKYRIKSALGRFANCCHKKMNTLRGKNQRFKRKFTQNQEIELEIGIEKKERHWRNRT